MSVDNNENRIGKKKLFALIAMSLCVFIVVAAIGFFVLSKIKTNLSKDSSANQEQFMGQAQTSEQLQAECQNSANTIADSDDVKQAFAEYQRHAENCREVYIVLESKNNFRSEGMYCDLAVDLMNLAIKTDKTMAFEVLSFAKTLQPWEYYMGPIVCNSTAVLAAHEESLKSSKEKICIKPEEFKDKVVNEIKNKNFELLEQTIGTNGVAWLGSPEADVGCPEKMSNIIKMSLKATAGSTQVKEQGRESELNMYSIVFAQGDQDKLMLEFGNTEGCLQLKAALVPGLHTNE